MEDDLKILVRQPKQAVQILPSVRKVATSEREKKERKRKMPLIVDTLFRDSECRPPRPTKHL
jgi:hypothetical protein